MNRLDSVCPHLGLRDDPTLMRTAPAANHRCFARRPATVIDAAAQTRFCLTADHTNCPFFLGAPARKEQAGAKHAGEVVRTPAKALAAWLSRGNDVDDEREEEDGHRALAWLDWLWAAMAVAIVAGFGLVAVTVGLELLRPPVVDSTVLALAAPTPAATPTSVAATATLSATAGSEIEAATVANDRYATPTPIPGGQTVTLSPQNGEAGWWASGDTRANHLGDSFLYAGRYQGQDFLATARFNLARIPRGADVLQATLRLTGLDARRLAADGTATWIVQFLGENDVKELSRADYLAALSAPAAITLPPVQAADLDASRVNSFDLDASTRAWLAQQLLDGATSVTVRLLPLLQAGAGADTLFAWDSGMGSQSAGSPPELIVAYGTPPPTPPPLPTKPFLVATLTPVPANVLTVVALAATATVEATTLGTATPIPYQVYTPTPFPENLETAQAVAAARGLPAVLRDTPTPANAAEATAAAGYITAVALTTGTYTPVPTGYVTPAVIAPSPPAENVATAAARVLAATATAEVAAQSLLPSATPTPLPYNAVIGIYVYATSTPGSVATAIAMDQNDELIARTTGTPTPLPWNAIIITAVPPPSTATATPIPLLIPQEEFTATPTATETGTPPPGLPPEVHGKILFKSDRGGGESTYMLDPLTNEVTLITQGWVFQAAEKRLGLAPDGDQEAFVQNDQNGILQIHRRSRQYGEVRQVTGLNGASYDPAWSPTGEWIAFVSSDPGGDEIYRVDPTGAISQRLTTNGWEWDKHPTWSPDGSQIVFYSNRDSGRRQLWIMHADGSAQRNLSSNEYNDWDPVWVP